MEKEVMKKELRMCMDYSEDIDKDNHDDVATRIVKEYIQSEKKRRGVEKSHDIQADND